MSNDRAEVDELTLEIAGYKNDYTDMAAEKTFPEVLDQFGKRTNTCRAACTMAGYPIVHVRVAELSKGYKC